MRLLTILVAGHKDNGPCLRDRGSVTLRVSGRSVTGETGREALCDDIGVEALRGEMEVEALRGEIGGKCYFARLGEALRCEIGGSVT